MRQSVRLLLHQAVTTKLHASIWIGLRIWCDNQVSSNFANLSMVLDHAKESTINDWKHFLLSTIGLLISQQFFQVHLDMDVDF